MAENGQPMNSRELLDRTIIMNIDFPYADTVFIKPNKKTIHNLSILTVVTKAWY